MQLAYLRQAAANGRKDSFRRLGHVMAKYIERATPK